MPVSVGSPQTLYDKVLSDHIVDEKLDGTVLLYIGTIVHLRFLSMGVKLTSRALSQIGTWCTRLPHL